MTRLSLGTLSIFAFLFLVDTIFGEIATKRLEEAGTNRAEIETALAEVAPDQREGLEFLVANMPKRDLTTLSADFLLENTRLAYKAWREDAWAKDVPKAIFLNNVLPYANDHLSIPLKQGEEYLVQANSRSKSYQGKIKATTQDVVVSIQLREQPDKSQGAVALLRKHLKVPRDERPAILEQTFATLPLRRQEVETCRMLLAQDRLQKIRSERREEWKKKVLSIDGKQMPFSFRKFGKRPKDGYSLYISLHGGGGAPARVNDQQWENQKRLYELGEGIYVAPRAPTNTWNLWHQSHIDPLFDRLIENFVAFEDVNWNRVYVMGYSAGGDGVYQLAPRMADRWAAAAMMAGHPNETSPLGLRNVPFALQVGGKDAAYRRNQVAQTWKDQLAKLHQKDPKGYTHFVKIYPNKGHWMDREDAVAIPWMAKYERNPTPKRVVWRQDDVTHSQIYWLGVDEKNRKPRTEVTADVDSQIITLSAQPLENITVYLDDRIIDLDRPIKILSEGKVLFEGQPTRTIASLWKTLDRRSS